MLDPIESDFGHFLDADDNEHDEPRDPGEPCQSSGEATEHDDELVEVASEDSFPASDAPSWTPVTGTGTPNRCHE